MYKGPLLRALKRVHGARRKYLIIEDGDGSGNTSRKGIRAKQEARIEPMTLPPRTPSLMPQDYQLWREIERRMLAGAPAGRESKQAFKERLTATAKSLPRTLVRKCIARMKKNLKALVDAKGGHPKND